MVEPHDLGNGQVICCDPDIIQAYLSYLLRAYTLYRCMRN